MSGGWCKIGALAIGIAVATAFLWPGSKPQTPIGFRIDRIIETRSASWLNNSKTNVVPDNDPRAWFGRHAVRFYLSSTQTTAIFVHATGVEIHTNSSWTTFSEQTRNEIWRLQSGRPQEFFVDVPEGENWRAYIRYGTEMHGLPLLKVQIRGAWKERSFKNWTGKAWGGGRFEGQYELRTEEFSE